MSASASRIAWAKGRIRKLEDARARYERRYANGFPPLIEKRVAKLDRELAAVRERLAQLAPKAWE